MRRLCASSLPPEELLQSVARRVEPVVPSFASGWQLTDPATQLPTARVGDNVPEESLLELIEIELTGADFLAFTGLARSSSSAVATLNAATEGDQTRSLRYRRVYSKIGWDDELRAVFRTGGETWGQACLSRGVGEPAFSPREAAFLDTIAEVIGAGLRTGVLLGYAYSANSAVGAPGLVVLQDDGSVDAVSDQALEWLGELPPERTQFPLVVYEVARRARLIADTGLAGPPARARVRLRSQQWLVLHGSRLRPRPGKPPSTAVLIEPARRADLGPLILQACELTPRERQIVEMLMRGLPIADMAAVLWLSPYTVRDHVKAVFAKLGVRSRPELTAKLFYEHYAVGQL